MSASLERNNPSQTDSFKAKNKIRRGTGNDYLTMDKSTNRPSWLNVLNFI